MANVQNLTTKHIAGHATKAGQRIIPNKSYEKTAALLFDKVLVKSPNWSHDFATKKQGILVSESLSVTYTDGTTVDYTNSNQRKSYITNMYSAVSAVVKGHAKGKDKSSVKVQHTQLVKTTEFGGQGVGTKKESKGTIFEREFTNRLKECINGQPCKGKYHKAAGYLIGQLENVNDSAAKDPNMYQIVDIEQEGGKNQPRPIEANGNTAGHLGGLPFVSGIGGANFLGVGSVGFQNGTVHSIMTTGNTGGWFMYASNNSAGQLTNGQQLHCSLTYLTV